ncbi:MAG: hypothetical protein A2020_02740 [Lentisphaerae bacterium GWF2_45_14]|nr:MAG: hypothetical protein A2020_02740 [Lentisphaerae bacterium GWF2_45_14]
MKIFVMVDMEGISGIVKASHVMPDGAHYQQGRKYMTWDVNACIEGCFRAGAEKVVVRDCHCSGYNLIWEDLDPRAEYIQGVVERERMPGIDGFDGLILLGYHAMAGTPQGVLEHTMSSAAWQNFYVNGQKAGEIMIDAAVAGDHGVPVIMVSGDDHLCKEADFLKGAIKVEVKKGLAREGAQLLSMKEAHRKITEGTEKAVKKCKRIKPLKIKAPVKLRLELVSKGLLPYRRENVKVIDGRTFETEGASMEDAFNMLT